MDFFWPFVFLFAFWVFVFPLVEFEKPGWAALTIIVAAAVMQLGFKYDVWGTIVDNPLTIVTFLAVYILIGVGYSFARWTVYCNKWARMYERLDDYSKTYKWKEKPQAANSKARLTTWMMFWPWNALWWFLSDFLTEVYDMLYRQFVGIYDGIANRAFAHLKPPPEKAK
jgi:hypothetical protein